MLTFSTGATRSEKLVERYDLIPAGPLKRVAVVYGLGAEQHGPDNWKLGMPKAECVNRAIRHIYEHLNGEDQTEDKLAKAVWNLLAAMYFEEEQSYGKHPADSDG